MLRVARCMLRLSVSSAFALFSMAMPTSAQSNFDCGKAYKNVLDKIKREQDAKMSGERLAALNRKVQRIYDACQTGHLQDPQALFQDLDKGRN
jgi:hypothetical protein